MSFFKNFFIDNFSSHKSYYLDGRKQVYRPDSDSARSNGYIGEHRFKAEKMLGRSLQPGEVVHHKDGNKLNNKISNLEVMQKKDHDKLHGYFWNKKK